MYAEATIDFVPAVGGSGCAIYLQGVQDHFRMNAEFPTPLALYELVTWTYAGALDLSYLYSLQQMRLVIGASMVNTSPAEEREGSVGAPLGDSVSGIVQSWLDQL
jgi:hypothetical protein